MRVGTAPKNAKARTCPGQKVSVHSRSEDLHIERIAVGQAHHEERALSQNTIDVDQSVVNVNGGSIAMGHPLGATGAMIIGTLLDELERSDKELGLATLCIASGMGAATIIERV